MPYEKMEEVLKLIHKEFILLDREEVKETKKILRETLIKLTNYMSDEDLNFKKLFKGFYFGGSFYHNLKVKKPDEFDIDFLLVLPKCETCKVKNCNCVTITPTNTPGFLSFRVEENCCPLVYQKFCLNGYMQTNLVFNWMKSLVYKALNRLRAERKITCFYEDHLLREKEVIFYTECTPALKICVEGPFGSIYIDIAAAFKLDQIHWPGLEQGYKANTTNKEYFLIVPMSPKGSYSYWRPSFQAQEKEIISNKERLKPGLRLLKIMRNNLHHKISSYMLKTLILEEADKYEWKEQTLSHTFMILLKKYIGCLHNKCLPYFWVKDTNLFDGFKDETLLNHHNEIIKLYNKIDREYETNPTVVAEVILKKGSEDYNKFMDNWNRPTLLGNVYTDNAIFNMSDNDDESNRYSCESDSESVIDESHVAAAIDTDFLDAGVDILALKALPNSTWQHQLAI